MHGLGPKHIANKFLAHYVLTAFSVCRRMQFNSPSILWQYVSPIVCFHSKLNGNMETTSPMKCNFIPNGTFILVGVDVMKSMSHEWVRWVSSVDYHTRGFYAGTLQLTYERQRWTPFMIQWHPMTPFTPFVALFFFSFFTPHWVRRTRQVPH